MKRLRARIIGIGQPAAGDDGVGPAVLRALRELEVPADVDLVELAEPTRLIPLLEDIDVAVVVDAVAGAGPPGTVLVLEPEKLDGAKVRSVSSHGVGVLEALELARVVAAAPVQVFLVAVSVAAPETYAVGLSSAVEKAVPEAARRVVAILEEHLGG